MLHTPEQRGAVSRPFAQDLIGAASRRHPDRVAVRDGAGQEMSYRSLAGAANRLAARLLECGVRPDVPVGVYLDRSTDLVTAMWAVLQAGGAYAPMDPQDPPQRTRELLRSVRPGVVISDRTVPGADELGVQVVACQAAIGGAAHFANPHPLHPDHLAYLLHTSGSTGVPKGVAMTHRGLSRLLAWQLRSDMASLRTLQFTSMCFDVTFQEILSTLANAGTLVLAPHEFRRNPEALLRFIEEQNVERIFLPYVALQQLAKAAESAGLAPSSLRQVITAGEQLVVSQTLVRFFARLPQCRLDNHYGPTEAHLVTSFTLQGPPDAWASLPPIGKPVDGTQVAILNEELQPVAKGEVGELFVTGAGLARGYLRAPIPTALRFIPCGEGTRMYRTGDLVREDSDGNFHFLGRADNQVKVRGYRVEPAEVEACLISHPLLRGAAVGLRRIADDVEVLVAYVVATALSRHVARSLPHYMVPSRIVFVGALPLMSSGKLDRARLADIELPQQASRPTYANAMSLTGHVRSVWERVLGHDEFGDEDDFFDVGGDSLLATWVVAELGQVVGRRIELTVMLRQSTIRGLATALDTQAAVGPAIAARESQIVTLRAGPSKRVLYLFHPLGGELLAYRALVNGMSCPMRILGVRWCPQHGGDGRTLEELAGIHLEQLRTIQPEGPYYLAGWSFGGVLAYEVAQQLLRVGARVAFLGLIDANPVRDPLSGLLTRDSPHLHTLSRMLQQSDRAGTQVGVPLDDPAVRDLFGDFADGLKTSYMRANLEAASTSMRAAMDYRPTPYPGVIDLLQAKETVATIREELERDLRALAGEGLRVHPAGGNHISLLRPPNSDAVAAILDQLLTNEGAS